MDDLARVELEALIAEREGMIAENTQPQENLERLEYLLEKTDMLIYKWLSLWT